MKNIHIPTSNQLKTCSPMGVVLTGKSQLATLQEIQTGEVEGKENLACKTCRLCIRAKFANVFKSDSTTLDDDDMEKITLMLAKG